LDEVVLKSEHWAHFSMTQRGCSGNLGKIVNARNQSEWLAVSSDDGNAAEEGVDATTPRN
jgi:hypothetical protein